MDISRNVKATAYAVGAVIAFIVCSLVQAAGDSDMFSTSYPEPGSALLDIAMNVTFWPGWLATAGLLFGAGATLFDID